MGLETKLERYTVYKGAQGFRFKLLLYKKVASSEYFNVVEERGGGGIINMAALTSVFTSEAGILPPYSKRR